METNNMELLLYKQWYVTMLIITCKIFEKPVAMVYTDHGIKTVQILYHGNCFQVWDAIIQANKEILPY